MPGAVGRRVAHCMGGIRRAGVHHLRGPATEPRAQQQEQQDQNA
ncbi:MAG: hypothetical protein ACTHM9_15590 [Gemmatimonadales bacterium]